MGGWIRFSATAERHHAEMCLFALVPPELVEQLGKQETFVVDMRIGGVESGRRTIKPWGDGRWFLELTNRLSGKLGFAEGDEIAFEVRPAPETPDDLMIAIEAENLLGQWSALTPACRRAYAEPVFAARRPETRERRIAPVLSALRDKSG